VSAIPRLDCDATGSRVSIQRPVQNSEYIDRLTGLRQI
jgi:hypothetical protein